MAANAARKLQTNKGSTGRYSKMTAAEKQEVDLGKMMGGVDWHASAVGIVIQEGRFVAEEYEPRDKKEIKGKLARIERAKERERRRKAGDDVDDDEEGEGGEDADDEEDPNGKAAQKRKQRQARLRALVKREGRVLASKDFPKDPVEVDQWEPTIQASMETSDAAELVAQKVRARFHKVNFNFRVTHFDKQPRPNEHAVTDFDREKAY